MGPTANSMWIIPVMDYPLKKLNTRLVYPWHSTFWGSSSTLNELVYFQKSKHYPSVRGKEI